MTFRVSVLFFGIAIVLWDVRPVQAAAPLAKVIMTSGSASERDGVLYVAQDLGLLKKYGVDLSFVQVRNGPVAMSALSSGETQFHWGSMSGANLGAIAERMC
jgi:ABC-type nitrate/sulfonate/bicarbonate transport system substrate-binding protein